MSANDRDFSFLAEALPQMRDYLLSNELYWPLSAALPRLTVGSVLLALARLHVKLPAEAQKLQQQLDDIQAKWRTAWEKKAAREISNRLLLWSNFLSDYENAPEQNADIFATEVRGRAIVQLLLVETPDFPEKKTLAELDAMLKACLRPAEFLWDGGLQQAFPSTDFWFLYGKL